MATLGVGGTGSRKNVAVKLDLGLGLEQGTDFYNTECLSVKSELDCSMIEDPSEVAFQHCHDDQEDGYTGNHPTQRKLQKQKIWKEPEKVEERQNNRDIKVERESDESELENENEEEEREERSDKKPTMGDHGSKKFTKQLKLEVIMNLKRIRYSRNQSELFLIPLRK